MLDFPSNSVLPPPCGRVKRQEGLNLLCYQLSLDEFFVAGRGVDREPGLLRGIRIDGTRCDARFGQASIRKRGIPSKAYLHVKDISAPTPESMLPGKERGPNEDVSARRRYIALE
jgi:hypothetical protein